MNHTLNLFIICLLIVGCKERTVTGEQHVVQREVFVSKSTDPQAWPYRYTLVRDQGRWTGEVECLEDDQSLFLCKMDVFSSTDDKLAFGALIGPGKAFPMRWELSLSKSEIGFDGVLVAMDRPNVIKPVRLKFVRSKNAILPSSELETKLRAISDSVYRTEDALQYEVALAKQEWEKESIIADRIAELRTDNLMGRGIRREWVGPAWVHERVKPEDSKYFERICCVYLGGTSVTDSDVQAISHLAELRELYLHRTGIADAALTNFGHLRVLRLLHLSNTNVSNEGLGNLRNLPNLKELYLLETKISNEGGHKLRSELPNTTVKW